MPAGWVAWILVTASIAAVGTWLVRRYALARNLMDLPGDRRSHGIATPRGGGLGIVVAVAVGFSALATNASIEAVPSGFFLAGLVLVSMIGWIDDHRSLSPWLRLAVHGVAGFLLAAAVVASGGGYWHALLAVATVMVLVNVWNFMDGIDGIATSQAMLVALFCAVTAETEIARLLAWMVLAACAGFLPFNFPKARIFLGDVGSGALGYLLAAILVLGYSAESTRAWVLLPLSAFLLDAALTLMTRILRGERWWTPHVGHLYQRLARRWRGHGSVTLAYVGWTLVAMGLAWWLRQNEWAVIMCAVVAWLLLGTWLWRKAGIYADPN